MTITKNNWWPIGLGLVAFILGPVVGLVVNISKPDAQTTGGEASAAVPNLGIFSFMLALAAMVAAAIALKQGQRSAVIWTGLILGGLALGYFVYIGVSELAG